MQVDANDDGFYALPLRATNAKIHSSKSPRVPMANYSIPLRTASVTDLYASVHEKVTGPSQIYMNEYYMVPSSRIPRTSASTAALHRVSGDIVPRCGLTRTST